MKALSIRQPWASLIAGGHKTMELRTWKTNYRGPLAIHASSTRVNKTEMTIIRIALTEVFQHTGTYKYEHAPTGVIIATCELADIIYFGSGYSGVALDTKLTRYVNQVDKHLCGLMDFEFVPYGWVLTNIKKLDNPIPCKGQLGLWEVEI